MSDTHIRGPIAKHQVNDVSINIFSIKSPILCIGYRIDPPESRSPFLPPTLVVCEIFRR
ncbi:unnamed protein product [Penicillium roqueforti FM164]|uniref:Uncharacterized protein n=1 Tax=Penicillium roqueforti (strain FM164) TaxID=1365484 RepID=W6QT97_PENRF|nr:unnamed protein product [Penicillium roqueforti FM164]